MADQGVDLIVTSGGLGPTAGSMTIEIVARFCGRDLGVDAELRTRSPPSWSLMSRFSHVDFDAVLAANRKQAMIPTGVRDRPGGNRARHCRTREADGDHPAGTAA